MTTATKITLVRIFLIPAFMVTMYLSGGTELLWSLVSFFIFVVASITDFVDGYIARRYDQTSDFGKFLDPLADKILTISALVCFLELDVRFLGAWMVVLIIAGFTYYISVAKGEKFKPRFLEMTIISISVAVISFFVGILAKMFLGVDI